MPNSSPRSSSRFALPASYILVSNLVLMTLLLPCPAALAQETTGAIEGTITGPDGKPLPDIVVIATMPATKVVRSTLTAGDGMYRIMVLPLGEYEIAIQDPGYQPVTIKPVIVRLGWTTALPVVQLTPRGELIEHVEVKGKPPVIDPVSTTIGGAVSAGLFDNLPVQRNYQSIATLLPGVSMSTLGDGLNIDGATGLENRYFVDGIEMTDPARGMGGTQLPPDFIQEVQVKTGGYEAEYRSALGGVVNVVTPSGSNQYSGKFIGYWTSHAVSRDPEQSSLELQTKGFAQYDAGFSLSGPLVRDRVWFFVAYDPEYQTVDTELPGLGYYDGSVTTQRFSGKVDWQVNGSNALVLTVVGDPMSGDVVGQLPFNVGSLPVALLNPDPFLGHIENGGVGVSLRGTHVLGPHSLLETSLSNQWRQDVNLPATTVANSEVLFIDAPTATWSGGAGWFLDTESEQLTVTAKATWALGQHELKAGAEYRQSKEVFNAWGYHTVTRYSDDAYFQGRGEALGSTENRIPSLFVQDSWRLGARWALNAGLRWAREELVATSGETVQTIDNEWQPRVGFVYQPGRIGTQRIFGSAARYYQELWSGALYYYAGAEGFNQFCSYDHDPRVDPSGGECLSSAVAVQPEVPGFHGNYLDEYALGYQLMLDERNRAGVRAIYRTLGDAVEDGLVTKTGSFVWGNPGRGPLAADYPRASRIYKALEFTFEGQPSARSGYLASYVWSENRGNYMGLWNTDFDYAVPNTNGSFDVPDALVDGDGLLPNDRTHVFKASAFYMFGIGLNVGASILWQSGTPLNEFGGSIYGQPFQTFLQQRGTAGRTPSLFDMSLRLDYAFGKNSAARWKPRLILDVYHLFSDGTPVDYDQIHYFNVDTEGNQIDPNPTYGWVSRYAPPTTVRLGFELSF